MGKHDEPPPQPDPTHDGYKPGQPFPHRQPGKYEKPDDEREDPGKQEKK